MMQDQGMTRISKGDALIKGENQVGSIDLVGEHLHRFSTIMLRLKISNSESRFILKSVDHNVDLTHKNVFL